MDPEFAVKGYIKYCAKFVQSIMTDDENWVYEGGTMSSMHVVVVSFLMFTGLCLVNSHHRITLLMHTLTLTS